MYKTFVSSILLLSVQLAFCQLPIYEWAKQFGSSALDDTYDDNGRSIAVDQQGNVYSSGIFFNLVDFDPGPSTYNMTAQGFYDIYISKLTTTGDFVWAKQIHTAPEGPVYLTTDLQANVYVTAYFSGTVDFDPGPAVYNLTSIGPQDVFILKLSANGDFVWAKQIGGPGLNNVASGYALDIDRNNNLVLCGSFYGTIDCDPGPNTFNLSNIGAFEVFITKLNSNGDFVWAKKFGNFSNVYGYVYSQDISCDNQGNIYMTGWFQGACDFDPGTGNFTLVSGGPADGFVAGIDGNGNLIWVKKLGNSTGNFVVQPMAIEIDDENNIYTTGSFLGTQDFDPGNDIVNLTSNGAFDGYILKLDAQGNFIWAKSFGGGDVDFSYDIAIDNSGDVYTIGEFAGSVDFDPGAGTDIFNLYDDAVLSKFDADGNFIYAAAFQRIFDGGSVGRRLVADNAQNIYITGSFGGTVDFDPGPGVAALDEGRGSSDAFVLKLAKCLNITTSNLEINSCDTYTLNNHKYDTSGVYLQTIPNVSGCDSIITLTLKINKKFSQQAKTICEGDLFYAGGGNQTKSGTYADTLQTSLGCDSVVTTYLTVNPKPLPELGPNKDLCKNTELIITPGSFSTYLWQDMSIQTNFIISGPGLYWVTVTNDLNCSATDSITINSIVQPPGNFLESIDSICSNDKLILQPSYNFSKYSWSTGSTEKTITIEAPGQYWLSVTDDKGCSGIDTITVFPKQCSTGVFIPTAFTPNSDGNNDLFRAAVHGKIQTFKLQVFDRSGQLIFQTSDPAKGWNGSFNGTSYSTATFVWQCFYRFEKHQSEYQKGTVTLIR